MKSESARERGRLSLLFCSMRFFFSFLSSCAVTDWKKLHMAHGTFVKAVEYTSQYKVVLEPLAQGTWPNLVSLQLANDYDGMFQIINMIHVLFDGMGGEIELWMKDFSVLVDCVEPWRHCSFPSVITNLLSRASLVSPRPCKRGAIMLAKTIPSNKMRFLFIKKKHRRVVGTSGFAPFIMQDRILQPYSRAE